MLHPLDLSEPLLKPVSRHVGVSHRTQHESVESRLRLGKIVEDNPDLPHNFIKRILVAEQEVAAADVTTYAFG